MASENENLDEVAADLQNSAKETLEKTETTGEAPAEDNNAAAFIHNVAHIVLDKGTQAADSSKTYIANVVHNVEEYAQKATSGASGSSIQETVSKSIHLPGSTTAGEGDASGTGGGIFTSIAGWCSSICGSKNAAGEPRSVDLHAAAGQVSEVLHSSADAASSYSVTPAETPAPKTEE